MEGKVNNNAAKRPAGNINRENNGQNSHPASTNDQITVPTKTAAKIQTPSAFLRKILNAEMVINSPATRKYQDPPNETSFPPPTM